MGRSALPLVLSQLTVVNPRGGQPAYVRSKRSIQTSAKLKRFQSCVGNEMSGQKGDRAAIRAAFTKAAKKCKGGG